MKNLHDNENKEWAEKIKSTNAVAMHARRLHGVPNQKNAKPNPNVRAISLRYYLDAMNEIGSQIPNPHFYCFSDYPDWFQENLRTEFPVTFIKHNQYGYDRSHEDFWLMSQCKHFIISNSTFSWWAAWLSNQVNKIVISPDRIFWGLQDIIPAGWHERSAL